MVARRQASSTARGRSRLLRADARSRRDIGFKGRTCLDGSRSIPTRSVPRPGTIELRPDSERERSPRAVMPWRRIADLLPGERPIPVHAQRRGLGASVRVSDLRYGWTVQSARRRRWMQAIRQHSVLAGRAHSGRRKRVDQNQARGVPEEDDGCAGAWRRCATTREVADVLSALPRPVGAIAAARQLFAHANNASLNSFC